jgi:hypothetical protein
MTRATEGRLNRWESLGPRAIVGAMPGHFPRILPGHPAASSHGGHAGRSGIGSKPGGALHHIGEISVHARRYR